MSRVLFQGTEKFLKSRKYEMNYFSDSANNNNRSKKKEKRG
jgi:hypothetical protein